MATKKDETASFLIRFNQKIFQSDAGEPQVQWRGNIRHVQGGDERRFSEFEDVISFIQEKLADLTIQALEDKSPEEQKGILAKSFDLWKRMAAETPKIVMETIKDPRKGVAQVQSQINQVREEIGQTVQSQFSQVKDDIEQKLDLNSWMASSKADYENIMQALAKLSGDVSELNQKVEELSAPKKRKPKSK